MCEKSVTPQVHFGHLPTKDPKSPYRLQGLIIFAQFFFGGGLGSHRAVCIIIAQQNDVFWFNSVSKLELWNIKSQFFVFLGYDMNRCVLPFVGQPIHTSLMGKIPYRILTYRLKFHVRHKKRCFCPFIHFANDFKPNFTIWNAPTYRWDLYENFGVW